MKGMNILFETVKNVVIYLILITVVMNLLGKSSYKKYIGIFTGMILIIIVISPILKLLNLDKNLDYYLDIQRFSVDAKELNTELSVAAEQQKDTVIQEYRNTLKNQINKLLTNMDLSLIDFDVTIEEDQEKENYGAIDEIYLSVKKGVEEETDIETKVEKITIEKITIDDTEPSKAKPENKKQGDSVLESLVKQEVGELYELEQNQIIVEIQEN